MNRSEDSVTQLIQSVAVGATSFVQKIPGLDLIFVVIAILLLYKFIRSMGKDKK